MHGACMHDQVVCGKGVEECMVHVCLIRLCVERE